MAKKVRRKAAAKSTRKRPTSTEAGFFDKPGSMDRISRLLDAKKLVPKKYRGTDEFLDVVSWNIRWFDAADPDRIDAITNVLEVLNADILVLTEIAADGALDEVVSRLAARRAGFYSVHYGTTGSQQRVVLMWDRDWVRSKEDPVELFADERLDVPAEFGAGRQRVFPRLPLWAYFEALSADDSGEGFNFELVGLHLKAQGPAPKGYAGPSKRWGVPQRTLAARRLALWLESPEAHFDADVIMIGDWNAKTSAEEWSALRALEDRRDVVFSAINKETDVTHLVRLNQSGEAGSRIDLHLITEPAHASAAVPKNTGVVIRWRPFQDLALLDTNERRDLFARLKKQFSDHLPVVSRFYLKPA